MVYTIEVIMYWAFITLAAGLITLYCMGLALPKGVLATIPKKQLIAGIVILLFVAVGWTLAHY